MDKFRFFDLNMGILPDRLPIFALPDVTLLPEGHLSTRIADIKQITKVFLSLSKNRMLALLPQSKTYPIQTDHAARICDFSENEDDNLNVSLARACRFHKSINILITILNLSSKNTDFNKGAQKC